MVVGGTGIVLATNLPSLLCWSWSPFDLVQIIGNSFSKVGCSLDMKVYPVSEKAQRRKDAFPEFTIKFEFKVTTN